MVARRRGLSPRHRDEAGMSPKQTGSQADWPQGGHAGSDGRPRSGGRARSNDRFTQTAGPSQAVGLAQAVVAVGVGGFVGVVGVGGAVVEVGVDLRWRRSHHSSGPAITQVPAMVLPIGRNARV